MSEAGIDTTTYSAHSTRAASTSKAALNGVPIDMKIASAGWTISDTLTIFYNKHVIEENHFGTNILKGC